MTHSPVCITALRATLVSAALALSASLASAQTTFKVQLDTSALMGDPAAPFSLDFQLSDGSWSGDGNNTAMLSDFDFGGGSAWGTPTTFGGAAGDLSSSVWLTDTDPFLSEFFQSFTAGSSLSFTVSLSTNVDDGGVPDKFTFAILDSNLANLATESLGTDAFVEVNLDQAHPSLLAYGAADLAIPAPTLTAVPEPSTYGLLGAALLGFTVWRQRRRR